MGSHQSESLESDDEGNVDDEDDESGSDDTTYGYQVQEYGGHRWTTWTYWGLVCTLASSFSYVGYNIYESCGDGCAKDFNMSKVVTFPVAGAAVIASGTLLVLLAIVKCIIDCRKDKGLGGFGLELVPLGDDNV